jgi:conjugative transfer pilus assembly protein TraH
MKQVLMILLLLELPLKAGMQDNLEKAFGALGMANNVTTAGGYQDQTGGFYTGGSVFGRSKVNNAELFSMQMPHYRFFCASLREATQGYGLDIFKRACGGFTTKSA